LWPVAVAQATTAAHNALGGNQSVPDTPIPMLVKGIGIDLISTGRIDEQPGDRVIVHEPQPTPAYARLTVHNGRIVGAILLGVGEHAPAILAAARSGQALAELHLPWA